MNKIFYSGKMHNDIFFQGHYHKAAYIGDKLVWEKESKKEELKLECYCPFNIYLSGELKITTSIGDSIELNGEESFCFGNGMDGTIEVTIYGIFEEIFIYERDLKLTKILSCLPRVFVRSQDLQEEFKDYKFLTDISPQLLYNFPELEEARGIFEGCVSLKEIPEDLFYTNISLEGLRGAFSGCTSLQRIPEGLFKHNPVIRDFNYAFKDCINLEGAAPEIWKQVNDPHGTGCFRGCTKLSNYKDIPGGWK